MKKKDIIFILVVGIVIGSVFAGYGAYAATTYILKSENVEYKDNSSLGTTTVQAAIDGTCTKIDDRLETLESKVLTLDKIYPVGSIYISTTISNADDVAKKLGGTWESYGQGRTLVGDDGSSYSAGTKGGAETVSTTLSVDNLPSHSHSFSYSKSST